MTSLRTLIDALLAALVAPPCAACARVLETPLGGAVCERCWSSIAACPTTFSLPLISTVRAVGPYEGALRDIIHALKYDGRRTIAPRLSRLMADHADEVLAGADLVIPVPLHRRRHRERGFNQAADLARGLGLPVVRALRRTRSTRPQVDLPAFDRHRNVRDAFEVTCRSRPGSWASQLENRVVVLVDDVTTTGATLEACARVVKRAGAREVRALTAARVVSGRR